MTSWLGLPEERRTQQWHALFNDIIWRAVQRAGVQAIKEAMTDSSAEFFRIVDGWQKIVADIRQAGFLRKLLNPAEKKNPAEIWLNQIKSMQ